MTEQYDYINLNDIDSSSKPIEPGVYTLEINKLDPVIRKPASGEFAGQEILVLKGSYTIVDDEKYSGRKFWEDFWTNRSVPLVFLKKQMLATGVGQEPDQSLSDWARQFEVLNPPAKVQVPIELVENFKDKEGPKVNKLNFFQAKPAV